MTKNIKIIVISSFVFWFALTCSKPENHTHSDASLSDATQSDTNSDADATSDADTNPNLDCRPGADPCYCDIRMYSQWYSCCGSNQSSGIFYSCWDDGGNDDYGVWIYTVDENPVCPAPDLPLCPWSVDNK